MLFLIITLATIIVLAYLFVKSKYNYWARQGIPYEEPVFPFGSLKGLGETIQFRDINKRVYDRFKGAAPFCGIFFLFQKVAVILDLDVIKHILIKDFGSFMDRGMFHNVRDDPLTGHLVNLDGEQWRAMRNKLTPIFTSGKMRYMLPTVFEVSCRLVDACGAIAADDAEGALELKELCARYTTDVIGTVAFGLDCNSLQDPRAEFREKGRSIFEHPRHSQLMTAFIVFNPKLSEFLRMKFFTDEVSEFFIKAVRETIDYRLKHNIKRNDFMDLMIEMRLKDEQFDSRDPEELDVSQGLSLLQIAAQAFVFFVAGFDTSSTTMSFCLYELALNPDIQEKVRSEIQQILGKYNNEVSYEALKEMHYLDQVINETLRKYPVLPHLVRRSVSDYKVPGSELVIKKDTTIIIPYDAIQQDPEIYPEPEKFDPSRFEPEEVGKRHSATFLPFGDGPRNCIGMRFGKMQAKVGLISLLQHYKFSRSKRTEVPLEYCKTNFVLTTKNGIYLHIDKI